MTLERREPLAWFASDAAGAELKLHSLAAHAEARAAFPRPPQHGLLR